MIEVLRPGAYTTVQDLGRSGMYARGMPPAGALDQFAARVANLLVGNAEGAAVLEITYQGPHLAFDTATVVAVTGADVEVIIDGVSFGGWASLAVPGGASLSFGRPTSGARAYLAVRGGLDVAVTLGSRSTYSVIGIGGLDGRPLRKGDALSTAPPGRPAPIMGTPVPRELRTWDSPIAPLRVVMGPHDHLMETSSEDALLASSWTATHAANRVGYRFTGPKLAFRRRSAPFGAGSDPSNVVDGCYPIGALQAPGGEELIVLLNDCVTAGGYAILGTVISADRDRIAQVRPGDQVQFERVTLEEAAAARRQRVLTLERTRALLA